MEKIEVDVAEMLQDIAGDSGSASYSSGSEGGEGASSEEAAAAFSEFMAQIEHGVEKMMKESSKAPTDAYEAWQAFSHAVNWQERWIQGLLAFHVVLLLTVLLARKNVPMQTFIFFCICLVVMASERINAVCAQNWRDFSTQNYFDEHGVFAAMLFSGPLLFIGFVQLIIFLSLSSSALIQAKKMEIEVKKKRELKWKQQQEEEELKKSQPIDGTSTDVDADISCANSGDSSGSSGGSGNSGSGNSGSDSGAVGAQLKQHRRRKA